MEVAALIDKAAERVGSRAALARALGQKPQAVTNWAGGRPCPLIVQARIAELAGLDPKDFVWEVVRRELGKSVKRATLGAAAMLFFGSIASAPPAAAHGTTDHNV